MKRTKLRRGQRSIMAVVVLLAPAVLLEVRANAAPRGADEAMRGTGKSGTEVTRLVTGDSAQINAVVAGGPGATAILAIVPVPAKVGSYPPGTTIIGNELRAEVGGFRAWFEVQVSNWDPNGDNVPQLWLYGVTLDRSGFIDSDAPGDQPDLAPARVLCTSDAQCVAAFGDNGTPIGGNYERLCGGVCAPAFMALSGLDWLGRPRPDSWCSPSAGGCAFDDIILEDEPPRLYWFVRSDAATGRPDGGIVYYGGTLVLDVPLGAKGKYCVELTHDLTFHYATLPGLMEIPTAQENGFVVNIVTGQCCFGLGTPYEGCIDGVLRSECGDDEPGPFIFTPDDHCPPQGPDCSRFVGSCCNTRTEECEDQVIEAACQGPHRVWTGGTSCGEASCIADTGACCDHDPFGATCTDDTVLSDCRCATCTWHKLQACAQIDCAPTPIPAVSEWGLAILTLLLLTAAKVYFGRRGMMHGDMPLPLRGMERAESTDGP